MLMTMTTDRYKTIHVQLHIYAGVHSAHFPAVKVESELAVKSVHFVVMVYSHLIVM